MRPDEPLRGNAGGAKNSARRGSIHLVRLIRAGFEPFRACGISLVYLNSPWPSPTRTFRN